MRLWECFLVNHVFTSLLVQICMSYLQFIKYFQSEINNSKIDLKDENILHNGIEIYPVGNRPYGEGINNRDREHDDDYW